MYLPITTVQDNIGMSYIQAMTSYSGYKIDFPHNDVGMDGYIKGVKLKPDGSIRENGYSFAFQLKSVYDYQEDDDYISYDLPVKNYNDLIDEEVGSPRILILFLMPRKKCEWITSELSSSIFHKCAIWGSLQGLPVSGNIATKKIRIPKKDIFDCKSIHSIMTRVVRGETIEQRVTI